MTQTPVLELRGIEQTYGTGEAAVRALRGIDLSVDRGDYLAIMGPSGSGKSTLMNLLGCLDMATSGQYLLGGVDVHELDDRQLAKVRNKQIGFVFQSFNLIQRMTALANVELPLIYGGVKRAQRRELALEALELVGLADRVDHRPIALSGGQQQRVAIARALASAPDVLLCDEPTSALDAETTESLLATLRDINATLGVTIVIVTHQLAVVTALCHRVAVVEDGAIAEQFALDAGVPPTPATRLGRDLLRLHDAARRGDALDFTEAALA